MPETILFFDDRLHASVAASSIHSVSSTQNGYNRDAVRETDFEIAWKPANSAADEYIQIDGGSVGWLGTTGGDTIYLALAYDASGCSQTTMDLNQDAADAAGGTFATLRASFTLNTAGPTVDYLTFALSSGGRRYYRLWQRVGARTGTATVKIFGASFFTASGVHRIGTDDGNVTGLGPIGIESNVGSMRSISGPISTNSNAQPSQRFSLPFHPGGKTLWEKMRNEFFTRNGPCRAFYCQFGGIKNAAKADFGMVRFDSEFESERNVRDELHMTVPLRTESVVMI